MKRSLASRLCSTFFCLFLFTTLSAPGQTRLIISQMYGGGGNTGAPFTYDFLELYNPTTSAINISGYSVQYAAATNTGNGWNSVALPNAIIAPGHYFLIQAAAGTTVTGINLPVTPDFTVPATGSSGSALNFSATAGKIAIVNNTTVLTTQCPLGATVVDFLGFGTTANCFEGTGPAPAPSNTTVNIRSSLATDNVNNSTDFVTGAPNPHNSSFGTSGTPLSATGTATPASVAPGASSLLTVTVTPGTIPNSSGIGVKADLTLIGGSFTQSLYDDATHGDVTAGDNIFSFNTTVTTTTNGVITLPVSVADAQARTASTSISITVNQPVITAAIHTIQGSKSTTALRVSPLAGQLVSTTGIVTAVLPNGFFIQAGDADADGDITTPEGIDVFTGSGNVPATAVVGNLVQVTGMVSTFPAVTASHTPATEITSPTVTLISSGNPLPTPITISTAMLVPGGGLYQLTPYEGMRVSIASITAISGTTGSITAANEANETATSTGYFYGVITGTARPFREPGIDIRDTLPTGAPVNIARFDDNPERILVDSVLSGGASIELSTGAVLTNVTGVLDFTFSADSFYDPSRLILDKTYNRANVTPGITVQPVAAPASSEFTVAAFNVQRFFNTNSADNKDFNPVTGNVETSSAVNVTAAAYSRRLAKVSLAIRNVLGNPDIVGLEEVENQSVAADIAAQISADATAAGQPDPKYVAFGTGTTYAPYTNDIGGISVGFLVKSTRVNATAQSVVQYGQSTTFTDPRDATKQQTLNDRPPLALHAGIIRVGAKDYPITVIVNHLRSLSGENDPVNGIFVRAKKEKQAEALASLIQGFQAAGEHVVSLGDYNVFEFSDGYLDVMATATGSTPLPADKVVLPGVGGLITPVATDLVNRLPADQRWSYQEFGNAQILDHIVTTQDLVTGGAHMAIAHLDADFPAIIYNDATTPARSSDHDVPVAYFAIPAPTLSAILTPTAGNFGLSQIGISSTGQVFTLTNTGEGTITINSIATSGDYSVSNTCGATLAPAATCTANVVFKPTAAGIRTGVLTVGTTAAVNTLSAALTGTGVAPADFTITDSAGSTTTTLPPVSAGSPASVTLTFTPLNGLSATITTTCVITSGTAPAGVTCTPPAPFTLSGTAAVTQTVTFATTSRTKSSGIALPMGQKPMWAATTMLTLSGILMLLAGRTRRLGRISGLLTLLLALCIPAIGCGGSNTNPNGTPAGTYSYTVTATAGALTRSQLVNLNVQ